jgi:WXG100 family type VII secretion target
MASVALSTKDILAAADEFESASRQSQELVESLEKVTVGLKGKWSGSAQEAFYKHHDEWQALMRGQVALLTGIAFELKALAERYEKADK